MISIIRSITILTFGAIILSLSSCGSAPVKPADEQTAELTLENYQKYLDDAEDLSPEQWSHRAIEVTDFLTAKKQLDRAHKLIDSVDTGALAPSTETYYLLVQAKIALLEGEPYIAHRYLFNTRGEQFIGDAADDVAVRFFDTRAQWLYDQSEFFKSVSERLKISNYLQQEELELQFNHDLIWEALAEIPTNILFDRAKLERDQIKEGWYSLAALSKSNGANFRQQIIDLEKWQAIWPDHPANAILPADLQLILQLADQQALNIAVFLPLSGKMAAVGGAIKEGIMSAYYDDVSQHSITPTLRFYDTTNEDINTLYDRALSLGHELVIGPLNKKNVTTLGARESLPMPILALNSVNETLLSELLLSEEELDQEITDAFTIPSVSDNLTEELQVEKEESSEPFVSEDALELNTAKMTSSEFNKPIFYFSLAVESEAQQVAMRAWRDGHRRALIIAPLSDWGDRGVSAFNTQWAEIGGSVVDEKRYKDQRSFSSLIEASVGIDKSKTRRRDMQRLLATNLEFEPRRRKDIDFIFLLAYPKQARQFLPLLAFHYAGDIPVYATSHVFSDNENNSLTDLNGLRFSTMPWLFEENLSERRAIKAFGENRAPYQSLYAMGVDAYHIYPRLEQLQLINQAQFYGATGKLKVAEDNTIVRTQSWAEITKGTAVELKSPSELRGEY